MQFDHILKLLLVGDPGVGKSTLVDRFCPTESSLSSSLLSYNPTIGVEYQIKTIQLTSPYRRHPITVKLQLFDTAGLDYYRSIRSPFYQNAHAVLLMFDLSDRSSFLSLPMWYNEAEMYLSSKGKRFLVGTKSDLTLQRITHPEETKHLSNHWDVPYYETSSLHASSLNRLFTEIVASLLSLDSTHLSLSPVNQLTKAKDQSTCCCFK